MATMIAVIRSQRQNSMANMITHRPIVQSLSRRSRKGLYQLDHRFSPLAGAGYKKAARMGATR